MKKRMLSILLALSLLLGMAPVHAEAASENGTAAVETEYLLHTAGAEREAEWVIDDQNALQNMGHGAYKLGADIELHEWTAIDFSGTLDGDGHTITLAGQPLFNELSGNVQNLLLDGAVEVENAAGALAFAIDGGVVNNCWSGVETFSYDVSAGFAGTMTGGNTTISVDMTAMALQALAKHQDRQDVKSAIDTSLTRLSQMQGIDGSYGNAESTAQVVLALCELGIDPHTDERFNGNGVSPVDALLQYARDDGSFSHTLGGDANGMSTEQALYTLAGVQRFYEKQNSLYDMNDVNLGDGAASGAVSGVTILPSGEQVLAVNDTLQLTARVLPVNAENKTVTWSSSHPEIVSVDNYGLLTAKKLGTATITVTTVDGGKTATLTVRVQDVVKVTGVSLDSVNSPVEVGKTVQLHATVRPANATNRALRWSSDNPRIATVSASGVVRGVAEGKATIYVATMDGNFTDSVEITVKDGSSVGTVKLSVDKLTIQKGFVIKPQEVELQKGDTVWDVLKRELDRRGIRYEYSNYTQYNSIYVESIDGDGEFDHGSGSGWKYNVNGIYPDYGCSRYVLKDGDSIQWRYTTNLGDDLDEYPIEEELKEENSPVELTPEVKPDANGDAIVRIEEEMFQKVLEQVAKEKLDQIRIQPKVNGKADKVGVVLPNASVKAAVNANKEIVIATPVATLVLERTALRDLTAQSGSITVSTETKQDGTMDIRVLRGGQTVQQVRGGVPITLPDVASPGMVLVLHQNGTESVVKKSVVSHGELSARLPGSVILSVENRAGEFEDISSDHWANDAVEFVTARELFTGTGSHHFSPDSEMSRAMLATVLFRLEEGKASYNTVFSDVAPDSWYGAAVAWAAEEGIVSGTGDGFHPDEAITREQLALMLYRYVKSAEGETEHNGSLSSFRDRGDVSDWAEEAVSWAVGAGILTGRGNKHLEPQATASRAEVAAMLMRMMPLLT